MSGTHPWIGHTNRLCHQEEDHTTGESTASGSCTAECRAATATSDVPLWKSNRYLKIDGPSVPPLKKGGSCKESREQDTREPV